MAALLSMIHFLQYGQVSGPPILFSHWLISIIWDIFSAIITSLSSFPYNIDNLLKIRSISYFFMGQE
jgi:hypothetical protein